MKLLINKGFVQKIVIMLVFVILFNFVSPQISFGTDDNVIGGILFDPIKDLTLTISDGTVNIIQSIVFGIDISILKLEHSDSGWGNTKGWMIGAAILGGAFAVFTGGASLLVTGVLIGGAAGYKISKCIQSMIPNTYYLPMYAISPAEIFQNKIALLDVNFFSPNPYDEVDTGIVTGKAQESSAAQLQSTISQWYFTIRNFAIVALLSILVYIGIRIVISSSAQDKAKYKQRLLDWLIAMCLLFFLHYVMAFAVTITELIVKSLSGINQQYIEVIGDDSMLEGYGWNFTTTSYKVDSNGDVTDEIETITVDEELFNPDNDMFKTLSEAGFILDERIDGSTGYTLIWPTNLMGKARIETCKIIDGNEGDNTAIRQFGYTLIFVGLVIYTVLFLFRYLKRLLMLAFLTIIAPLVAMTYPLDKMSDGSAQAFNMWLKEYVYNLLIQPVHLILYTVLIGSATEFAAEHLVYALAAFGFMLQAEKIMRKLFGFEKASTLAGGSALGGAMAMQGINMLRKIGGPKKGKGGAGGKDGGKDGENSKVRIADRKPDKGKDMDSLLDSASGTDNERAAEFRRLRESGMSQEDSLAEINRTLPFDREQNPSPQLDPEQDTRGIGQWLKEEKWNGSKIQKGLNNFGTAAKTTASAGYNGVMNHTVRPLKRNIGNGVQGIRTKADNIARAKLGGAYDPLKNTGRRAIKGATSVAKGLGALGLKVLGAAGKAAIHAAPEAAKLAVKGTVAGASAMGGIAAGLVSDDFGNVGKWGAAGAASGWIGAGGAISSGEKIVGDVGEAIPNAIESMESTYTIKAHGYEAEQKRQKDKADKAAVKDKARRELYASKLGLSKKEDIEKVMQDYQQYREAGITDDDIIIKTMNAKDFGEGRVNDDKLILAGLGVVAKNESGSRDDKLSTVNGVLKSNNASSTQVSKFTDGVAKIFLS